MKTNELLDKSKKFLEKNWGQVILTGMGVILMAVGLFFVGGFRGEESEVEILTQEEEKPEEFVVDVGGAVEKPGVYKLEEGTRINDVLIVAGGVSAEADREYLARYVNLAQKIRDGSKIYILKKSDKGVIPRSALRSEGAVAGVTGGGLVNVNTASAAELDKLWGIGPVTAQKIIEGRPYSSVEELLTKKVLKKNVYERNKDKLGVF